MLFGACGTPGSPPIGKGNPRPIGVLSAAVDEADAAPTDIGIATEAGPPAAAARHCSHRGNPSVAGCAGGGAARRHRQLRCRRARIGCRPDRCADPSRAGCGTAQTDDCPVCRHRLGSPRHRLRRLPLPAGAAVPATVEPALHRSVVAVVWSARTAATRRRRRTVRCGAGPPASGSPGKRDAGRPLVVEQRLLVPMLPGWRSREYPMYALWHVGRPVAPRVTAFVTFLAGNRGGGADGAIALKLVGRTYHDERRFTAGGPVAGAW